MNAQRHVFAVKDATDFGMIEALLLENFRFWIQRNQANETHFHANRTWTYNSVAAYQKLFPYLTKKQIRSAIDHLVDRGILLKDRFSKNPCDRVAWYAFADERNLFASICPKGQIDTPCRSNGIASEGKITLASQGKSHTDSDQIDNSSSKGYLEILSLEFPVLNVNEEYRKCVKDRIRKKLPTKNPSVEAMRNWLKRVRPEIFVPSEPSKTAPPWEYRWPASVSIYKRLQLTGEEGLRQAVHSLKAEPVERHEDIFRDLQQVVDKETLNALRERISPVASTR